MTAQPSFQVRIGSLRFNPEDPASQLGRGHFGVVFVGRHGDGGEACAVKRMDRLRFEAEGGQKEIEALRHAQVSIIRILNAFKSANRDACLRPTPRTPPTTATATSCASSTSRKMRTGVRRARH